MESVLGDSLTFTSLLFLALALLLALSFEFVNGFHDTANAVATVIYTNSLKPTYAVVWSGLWNLTGVLLSAGTVAFGILALLPVELVINVGSGAGFAMVFALLISAIIWNVGTWYFGLPASSSHTLIGSIVGVGLANSVLSAGHTFGDGVNWGKVQDTLLALVVSPVIGFVCSGLLLLLFKLVIKNRELYAEPDKSKPPAPWIRALLILTCTGVSFAHGSNDGQKGMGLIMLILIGVVPGVYALDLHMSGKDVASIVSQNQAASAVFHRLAGSDPVSPSDASDTLNAFLKNSGKVTPATYPSLEEKNAEIGTALAGKTSIAQVPVGDRKALRSNIYLVSASIAKLVKKKALANPDDATALNAYHKALDKTTNFIPVWVKVAVALCLGLGTMIGWKRIVVTVGERIGKTHLSYGQGASAEIVAYGTIQAADIFGLPVSTTHILSSGVAGTMAANGSGLQMATLRNILLAWVLTLPVCVFLGSMLFAFGLRIVAGLGLHESPEPALAGSLCAERELGSGMIVVVGAGLIGLGIAYELARRGAQVRVIDAREPGGAASWAGAGMLAPYTESIEGSYEAFCARSLALYPDFVDGVRECGGVDARLRLDGILEAAFDATNAERLQAHVAALAARGIAARWLDRDAALRREPALGGDVLGASLCEPEGSVDNRRLGRALRAACAALDVPVDAHAGEVALEADARRVLGVRGPAGFVPASHVVNATGAWAGHLAGVPAASRVPVVPVKGQMLALAMPHAFVGRTLWVPGAYLVPRDDGRLLVGATVEEAGFDVRVTARGVRTLLDAALRALPSLGDLAVAETWAGLRPGSPDGLPCLGETATAGYFVASGHYRNGILLTPATAAGIADAIEDKDTSALAAFSPRRFEDAARVLAAKEAV